MAGLQERSGRYRIHFRFNGKQHFFTLGQVSKTEAEAKVSQVNYLLMRIKQRLATLPTGMGIVEFVQFDGQSAKRQAREGDLLIQPKWTLAQLRDRYLATHESSLASTFAVIKLSFFAKRGAIQSQDLCGARTV